MRPCCPRTGSCAEPVSGMHRARRFGAQKAAGAARSDSSDACACVGGRKFLPARFLPPMGSDSRVSGQRQTSCAAGHEKTPGVSGEVMTTGLAGGQTVEKPPESSRGPEPSRTTIVPGGVNGGDGRVFAVFAAGIRRIQAKTGEGGRGGGACFPVHQLVKRLFDKRNPRSKRGGVGQKGCRPGIPPEQQPPARHAPPVFSIDR